MAKQIYGGFWIRLGAVLLDSLLLMLIVGPMLTLFYGMAYWTGGARVLSPGVWDLLLGYGVPIALVIGFWIYKSATPGKMATSLTIVDSEHGGKPSNGQFVLRYLGYFVSSIPFMLGFLWVAFDKRKQGFHDKIAGTVVVRQVEEDPEALVS